LLLYLLLTNLKTNSKIMKILINQCYGGYGLSDKFERYLKEIGLLSYDAKTYSGHYPDRDDQAMIEEAIKFGLKGASGDYAQLAVVEIPNGALYRIGEYDGQEWIEHVWIEVTIDELRNGLSTEQLDMVSQGCDVKLKSQ
jgi:hypothetical protein